MPDLRRRRSPKAIAASASQVEDATRRVEAAVKGAIATAVAAGLWAALQPALAGLH